MNRRQFLKASAFQTLVAARALTFFPLSVQGAAKLWIDPDLAKTWEAAWEKSILADRNQRYCDKEMGEEIGWLISHYLNGFYYGYLAAHDEKWIDILVDWADSWLRRGVKEPDGFIGWPKKEAAGTDVDHLNSWNADSLLGEAMGLRPLVLMADKIQKTPALASKYGDKAKSYLAVSEKTFAKWEQRGAFRETKNGGGIWVVLPFGMDATTGNWTEGYEKRNDPGNGFSIPNNKANFVARWHLAMFDATGKPVYRERAEKWFRLFRSRLHERENGKYFVWNYWEPAGPWDYKPNGSTKHWVGVHPNGGYYQVDLEGVAAAYEHGLVFTKADIDRFIATNRDFMWNQKMEGAKFQRIDGGEPAEHWKDSPGVLWESLIPYDETLRRIFVANHKPGAWGGIASTPWFLDLAQNA
jgi:hypothetical protein